MERSRIEDAVLAAGAVVVVPFGTRVAAQGEVPPAEALDGRAYALLFGAGLVLVARRRFPWAVLVTTLACCSALVALNYPFGPVFLTLSVALYTVTAHRPVPHGVCAFLLSGTALVAADSSAGADMSGPGSMPVWYASMLLPYGIGLVVRANRRALLATAEAEAARAERRAQEERARQERRAQEERLAIAREIHDVLGHSLTLINMRAGAALHVASRRPRPGGDGPDAPDASAASDASEPLEALESIKKISKEALRELRTTLGTVREHGSRPGADRLPELVASMGGAGVEIELNVTGEASAAAGHVIYRIVQESLTNVLRHSGARRAVVTVGRSAGHSTVTVTDDGAAPAGPEGSGITGMRARAEALGGTLTAGPREGGGFTVEARLPDRLPLRSVP
ncbi:two-component sensor histidine kinase [Planobispora rosea]|uniref:histidine kinase n=1 Tax=Planobispora rosea TaxID=35762 RepID=A0A8J3WAL0_PLARO|nr:histidine kinase [Planobispora rosea]GGS47375.1 two-component sensor histidine kinase [Planobispora rosea]GIH82220.1 two-component sensor histidine kinase [Planobispora rosea]